jgi:acetyl-CoA C-acetyltransferase
MSRVPMGSDGGAMATDPQVPTTYFVPQGISADLIATQVRLLARGRRCLRGGEPARAAAAWQNGLVRHSVVPIRDHIGEVVLDRDEHMRPDTTLETWPR